MAYVITERCAHILDLSCIAICPVDAIHGGPPQQDQYYIDPVACIDCGACQYACPAEAIFYQSHVPRTSHWTIEANRRYFSTGTS